MKSDNLKSFDRLWNIALLLAIITVLYNVAEGLVSTILGANDETLSLFGFGMDSFIEVISGIGIWHMIVRVKRSITMGNHVDLASRRDRFEKTALRITGMAFYILALGLAVTVVYNILTGSKPQTTFWGIIIALISIITMIILMQAKIKVGKKLNSDAIIADAHCTRTCVYLSIILLAASILYEIFKIGYIDSIGALGIAYFSFKEGKEAMEKAKGKECCCHES
jgi:hypothetical protein